MKELIKKLKKDIITAAIEGVRIRDTTRLSNYVGTFVTLKKKRK